ncbi:MAG TPA: hypothetical protein VKX41_16660 [Alloacidobacterium sp.]|nr:hypothetical protein [Alloacidobacterium sp.]
MIERPEYWKGFTGGFVAGVAVGAWVYFSPRGRKIAKQLEGIPQRSSENLSLHRESAESAGDPSSLISETAGATRLDFERPPSG